MIKRMPDILPNANYTVKNDINVNPITIALDKGWKPTVLRNDANNEDFPGESLLFIHQLMNKNRIDTSIYADYIKAAKASAKLFQMEMIQKK
ncbi:hypothetical protein [Flavihumibacter fluvii]|uniref:hypothetical protein n=1 Tax=Flavihumibacter fluvii TaxID=2838157 RepID=UPI001BDEFDC4|nr:hypothetical protein [Flavihumibacter fluvii]ULQ54660.1 hypothetical protein KJS93_10050 [Flavihumibacter fluvii]